MAKSMSKWAIFLPSCAVDGMGTFNDLGWLKMAKDKQDGQEWGKSYTFAGSVGRSSI